MCYVKIYSVKVIPFNMAFYVVIMEHIHFLKTGIHICTCNRHNHKLNIDLYIWVCDNPSILVKSLVKRTPYQLISPIIV